MIQIQGALDVPFFRPLRRHASGIDNGMHALYRTALTDNARSRIFQREQIKRLKQGAYMPWTYQQSTGELSFNGELVETGYSGAATGKNNPAMQAVPNVGPIPRGNYQIGEPHSSPHTGTFTLNLSPMAGTNTFGRSAFRMHGDSLHHPGTASEGCIIMGVQTRHRVWSSGDRRLEVTQ